MAEISWVEGKPDQEGDYWIRLSPTNLLPERMQKHNRACHVAVCGCHSDIINIDERTRRNLELGLYIITGHIKLPNPNDVGKL